MKSALNALLASAAFVFTLALWGAWNSLAGQNPGPEQVDLASHQSDERTTVLKPISPEAEPRQNEQPTLLYDPTMSQRWGLEKTDTRKAWKISQGAKDIVIAIIDTGADIHHSDLKNAIWTNPGESGLDSKGRDKSNNGIDDDKNGFIDDVHGWNFVANNNDVTDHHGHGTHVAGIIGADSPKGPGASGIAPKSSLMILKYYDPQGPRSNNLTNTVQAIRYAVKMKAKIINYSGGGVDYAADEYKAISEARDAGILFVAAAGNERANSDKNHYYPADYKLDNIISVTAIDPLLKVLSSSNYGTETVDIAAPGENIYSTFPNNSYGTLTGTSQATAFVTGVAALVMANNRDFTATEVRKHILATGDHEETLIAKTGTSRRLNSYKALAIHDRGTSLTGIKAQNTQQMAPGSFSGDPQAELRDSGFAETEDLALFTRTLVKSIGSTATAAVTP
jgi:subtilisin family serine protease